MRLNTWGSLALAALLMLFGSPAAAVTVAAVGTLSVKDSTPITDGATLPVVSTAGSPTVAAGDINFTAVNQAVVIDTQGYGGFSFTTSGTWVGGVQVLWSNKPTGPWKNGVFDNANAGSSGTLSNLTAGSNDQFTGPKGGRYMEVLANAYTSGTIVVTPVLLRDRPVVREVYINNSAALPAPVYIQAAPTGSAGEAAPFRLPSSAATTNTTSIRGTVSRVRSIIGRNTNAGDRYLKLYNKSSPTVGTDTPLATFTLPPGAFAIEVPGGIYFSTALSFAITAGAADNDTTAIGAGDITGLNIFSQ